MPSDIVTLDFDYCTPEFVEQVLAGQILPEYTVMAHSTRSHTPEKPRLRIVVFLKGRVARDQYQAASRIIAKMVDPEMAMVDKVSFRPAQMMYMPTVSSDMLEHYIFYLQDGTLLDHEDVISQWELLNGSADDIGNLPRAAGEDELRDVLDKSEDPLTKPGSVGDFCRAYPHVGAAMFGNHYNVPEDAPGLRKAEGKLIWLRELRLCLVPDGHGGFAPAIESRPRVEVEFQDKSPFAGRHHVIGGYEPSLQRRLFYASAEDGGHVWPHIRGRDGDAWRLRLVLESGEESWLEGFAERDPESTGWYFDPDPVRHPGDWFSEPWYLSYTSATAPYLRHWLTADWRLRDERAVCPWNRSNFDAANPEDKWNCKLPPIHGLNFPNFSFATWIECCLHNGMIEKALQSAIDRLKDQVVTLQAEWYHARERHSNALLKRWKTNAQEQGG